MHSIGELISQLQALLDDLQNAIEKINAAHDQVEQTIAPLAGAAEGSSNELVEQGLSQYREGQERIKEAQALATRGNAALESYIHVLGGGSGGSNTGGAGIKPPSLPPPAPPAGAPRPDGPRRITDFNPHKFDRRGMEEVTPYKEARTAEGRLFTAEGEELANGTLRATTDGFGAQATDIKDEWTHNRSARVDIEGNVAATMRTWRIKKTVLYLNTPPCKGPLGCDAQLPAYLPEGYTLHVHALDRRGQPFSKSYTGTGEALK